MPTKNQQVIDKVESLILKGLNCQKPPFFLQLTEELIDAKKELDNLYNSITEEQQYDDELLKIYFYYYAFCGVFWYANILLGSYFRRNIEEVGSRKQDLKQSYEQLELMLEQGLAAESGLTYKWQALLSSPAGQQTLMLLLFCDHNPRSPVFSMSVHKLLAKHLFEQLKDPELLKVVDYLYLTRTGEQLTQAGEVNPIARCEQGFADMIRQNKSYDEHLIRDYFNPAIIPDQSNINPYIRIFLNNKLASSCVFYTLLKYPSSDKCNVILDTIGRKVTSLDKGAFTKHKNLLLIFGCIAELTDYNSKLNLLTPSVYSDFYDNKVNLLQMILVDEVNFNYSGHETKPKESFKSTKLNTSIKVLLQYIDERLRNTWVDSQLNQSKALSFESQAQSAMTVLEEQIEPLLGICFSKEDARLCQYVLSLYQTVEALELGESNFSFDGTLPRFSAEFLTHCNKKDYVPQTRFYISQLVQQAMKKLYQVKPPSEVTDIEQIQRFDKVYYEIDKLNSQLKLGLDIELVHQQHKAYKEKIALDLGFLESTDAQHGANNGSSKGQSKSKAKNQRKRRQKNKQILEGSPNQASNKHDSTPSDSRTTGSADLELLGGKTLTSNNVVMIDPKVNGDKASFWRSNSLWVEIGQKKETKIDSYSAPDLPDEHVNVEPNTADDWSLSTDQIPQLLWHLALDIKNKYPDHGRFILTGGAIPALLLNQPDKVNDFDCLVNVDLDELYELLISLGYNNANKAKSNNQPVFTTQKINAAYPLVKVCVESNESPAVEIEIAQLKGHDHKPLEDALSDNMHERDFALSAMYVDLTEHSLTEGNLQPVDVVGGIQALKQRQITMHVSSECSVLERFQQDPVRLLRLASLLLNYDGELAMSSDVSQAVSQVNSHSQWCHYIQNSDKLHKRMNTKFGDMLERYSVNQVLSVLINKIPIIPALTGMPLAVVKGYQPIWNHYINEQDLNGFNTNVSANNEQDCELDEVNQDAYKQKLRLFYCLYTAYKMGANIYHNNDSDPLYDMANRSRKADKVLHECRLRYLVRRTQKSNTRKFGILSEKAVDNMNFAIPLVPLLRAMEAKLDYHQQQRAMKPQAACSASCSENTQNKPAMPSLTR